MKFSEIKGKIKNIGNFTNLSEIKEAGLRIVKNTKTGDYWLIENEFLKPVIKSPRECKSIMVKLEDLKYKVFMCHKSREELKETYAFKYIEWGEKQNYHKRPTCASRSKWWYLCERNGKILWSRAQDDNHRIFYNEKNILVADTFSELIIKDKYSKSLCFILNSYLTCLSKELFGRTSFGEGALGTLGIDIIDYFIINPFTVDEKTSKAIITLFDNIKKRSIKSIFEELGIDPSKSIRSQMPNPLPDRKALDDIIFDILGLTQEERNEVYWAVCELVKNRLEKAKSV